MGRNWKHIGLGSQCDYCDGSDNVHRYKNIETGERHKICEPCEQAASAVA